MSFSNEGCSTHLCERDERAALLVDKVHKSGAALHQRIVLGVADAAGGLRLGGRHVHQLVPAVAVQSHAVVMAFIPTGCDIKSLTQREGKGVEDVKCRCGGATHVLVLLVGLGHAGMGTHCEMLTLAILVAESAR